MSDSGLAGLLDLDLLPRIFLDEALFDVPSGVFIRHRIKQPVKLIGLRSVLSSLNLWGRLLELRLRLLGWLCRLFAPEIINGGSRGAINFGLLVLRLQISILAQGIACGFRRNGNVPRRGRRRIVWIPYKPP